jgi:hypothetical protein
LGETFDGDEDISASKREEKEGSESDDDSRSTSSRRNNGEIEEVDGGDHINEVDNVG